MEDFLQEQETREPLMLHIVDGESVAGTLRQSRLPGRVMIYGDLLYEGPVPAGLEARGWNEVRARFYCDAGYTTMEEASRIQLTWQRTLESCSVEEEVVLWTDHRLTDQLILLRVLDWLSHEDLGKTRISLISVGRYPGIDSFVTLGQHAYA